MIKSGTIIGIFSTFLSTSFKNYMQMNDIITGNLHKCEVKYDVRVGLGLCLIFFVQLKKKVLTSFTFAERTLL